MGAATSAQLAALKALFGAVPDATLRTLERALVDGGPSMAPVCEIIAEEKAERGLREIVFGPVSSLFQAGPSGPSFPPRMGVALWAKLKARHADLVELAAEESRYLHPEDPQPPVLDELCLEAVKLLRQEQAEDAQAQELAIYLELAPLARQVLSRLPDWLGRVTEERTAVLKIILRDASAVAPDGAPRLLDLLVPHMPEPELLLRIISVVTDRANDRYLGVSELARFGHALLDEVDGRLERLRTFDPGEGEDGADAVGEDVTRACAVLAEFERSVEITRDGPWGKRVTEARRRLAGNVESRLRDMEDALTRALPTRKSRYGRAARPTPVYDQDPPPAALARAKGLFAFLEVTRGAAQVGGYGALRAQICEKLRERLADYADETIHALNADEMPPEHDARARDLLALAAGFMERADDPKGAQLIRRRANAAGAAQPAA